MRWVICSKSAEVLPARAAFAPISLPVVPVVPVVENTPLSRRVVNSARPRTTPSRLSRAAGSRRTSTRTAAMPCRAAGSRTRSSWASSFVVVAGSVTGICSSALALMSFNVAASSAVASTVVRFSLYRLRTCACVCTRPTAPTPATASTAIRRTPTASWNFRPTVSRQRDQGAAESVILGLSTIAAAP